MTRSWPTVSTRFFSSSTSIATTECFASRKVAKLGRSVSFRLAWHELQTRTSYSKPMIGMLMRFGEHLSHIALPQFLYWRVKNVQLEKCVNHIFRLFICSHLQWCWRFGANCFCSNIALKFQKNGVAQSWHVSLSTQSGAAFLMQLIWVIIQFVVRMSHTHIKFLHSE